jgi:anti-anti-sigma regulatory factor
MTVHVRLNEQVTLQTVALAHAALCEALDSHDDVVIDASPLIDGDLSLIQLLITARAEAARRGQSLSLSAPAQPALCGLLTRAGFAPSTPDDINFWFHGACPQ